LPCHFSDRPRHIRLIGKPGERIIDGIKIKDDLLGAFAVPSQMRRLAAARLAVRQAGHRRRGSDDRGGPGCLDSSPRDLSEFVSYKSVKIVGSKEAVRAAVLGKSATPQVVINDRLDGALGRDVD